MEPILLDRLDRTASFFLEKMLNYTLVIVIIFSLFNFSSAFMRYKINNSYSGAKVITDYDVSKVHIEGARPEEKKLILQALKEINYPFNYEDYTFEIRNSLPLIKTNSPGSFMSSVVAEYSPDENKIYFQRPLLTPSLMNMLPTTLSHEMAHQLDALYLEPKDRERIMSIRNYPVVEWRGSDYPWEFQPAEDFAEIFSYSTTLQRERLGIMTSYKQPTSTQQAQIMTVLNNRVLPAGKISPIVLQNNQEYRLILGEYDKIKNLLNIKWIISSILLLFTLNIFIRTFREWKRLEQLQRLNM